MKITTINISELFKNGCVKYFTRLDDLFSQYDKYTKDPHKYFFEDIYRNYSVESAYRQYLPLITEPILDQINGMNCENTILLPLFQLLDNMFYATIDRLTNPAFYEGKGTISTSDNAIELEISDICNAIMKVYDVPDKLKWFISYFKHSIVNEHTTYCFSLHEEKYEEADMNAFFELLRQYPSNPYDLNYSYRQLPNLKEFPISFENTEHLVYTFVSCGVLKNLIKNKNLKPEDAFYPEYGYFINSFKKMTDA